MVHLVPFKNSSLPSIQVSWHMNVFYEPQTSCMDTTSSVSLYLSNGNCKHVILRSPSLHLKEKNYIQIYTDQPSSLFEFSHFYPSSLRNKILTHVFPLLQNYFSKIKTFYRKRINYLL